MDTNTPETDSGTNLVRKLISELTHRSKEDRSLMLRKTFQAVQLADDRRSRAEKQYLIALKVLRHVVGEPTFVLDGHVYQIRIRDGRPFLCSLDHGIANALAA